MSEVRRPARVLRVVTRLVGGAGRQAVLLTSGMAERGLESRLIMGPERDGSLWEIASGLAATIPSLQRELSPPADARALRGMYRQMRTFRPHIVHSHMSKAGALSRVAARAAGVPIVVHSFHGHVLHGYFSARTSAAYKHVERALAPSTDALVAVSRAVRDQLLELGVGRPSQWHVIPTGVVGETLNGGPDPVAARERLELPREGPLVGIVARLDPIKNVPLFLEAAARIKAGRPDVSFVIAGDGEQRQAIHARARALLGDRVHLLGWVRDLDSLYAALDVVLLTSRNEGTPRALIEAGAASTPTVATTVGGVADVLIDGVTGLLVAPGDAGGLAERTLELLADQPRARAIGEAAARRVRAEFSQRACIDRTLNLYRDLLARRRPGGARHKTRQVERVAAP